MAAEEEKQESKGFTVQDRRRFSPETGEARDNAPETHEAASQASPQSTVAQESADATRASALPEIDFSTFVISVSTQALMHLGEIASPDSGEIEADISVAKQMIDILGMLKEKTRGNLNADEDRLIEGILFDLRMKYVEAVKKR